MENSDGDIKTENALSEQVDAKIRQILTLDPTLEPYTRSVDPVRVNTDENQPFTSLTVALRP